MFYVPEKTSSICNLSAAIEEDDDTLSYIVGTPPKAQ
jgi:hypothetical protein